MTRNEAVKLRKVIESAVQSLQDETALQNVMLFPEWETNTAYASGFKVQHDGKLWRCLQAHTAIETWEPENAASLWEQINETHAGTLEDPIPYTGNMALENGKYYLQDNMIYLCIRDTENPVYNALAELVGVYVEAV